MKPLLWILPLSLGLAVVFAQQPPTQKGPGAGGSPSPEVAFRFLDTNRDGRLDKREFAALPRMKEQPAAVAEAAFAALDKNKDGYLSLEEFRDITAWQAGAKRRGGGDDQPQFATQKQTPPAKAERAASPEELAFFESKIRPVLVEKCSKCHAAGEGNKVKGGLALDSREGARKGGDSGPAVVPGDMKRSLLLDAIRYANKELQMPPEKDGGKLADSVIKDFERWVQMGAPDPRTGGPLAKKEYDGSKAKDHWAYQPPKQLSAPTVKNAAWPKTDLDRFVLANLEAKGLAPVADADRLTLLRRVYFDLIGLPPSFEEINAFLDDASPGALAKVVDRLLASPQFGERWGRHWLDVARYAESTGKDVNTAYPHAWRYRNYVIAAFNADKPYDRFIREQIAGDLLPAANDRQRGEQLVATGFLALGTKSVNEQNPKQFFLDVADEQIDTVSQAILGTTIACARCHDHKFDPIAQKEYYALAGIFTSTETRYGTAQGVQNRHPSELMELPAESGAPTLGRSMSAAERAREEKKLAELRQEFKEMFADGMRAKAGGQPKQEGTGNDPRRTLDRLRMIAESGQLEARLKQYYTNGTEKALAMGVQDLPASRVSAMASGLRRLGDGRIFGFRPPEFSAIGDLPLYTRGDVEKPSDKVARAFPVALTHSTPPRLPTTSSGRKELAEWLTTAMNPLTARVFVNRVWGWLFGKGIVDSPDNFGTTGGKPANQSLLDTLAVKFMAAGWSTKKLVREIVLSRAYQLASTYHEANHTADPENAWNWRMTPRRLDAEGMRDAMLTVSGQLDLQPPVTSVVATMGDLPIDGPNRAGMVEAQLNAETTRRSVYLPIVRDKVPDALALFDFAEPSLVTGARESTSVPAQALFLLNSDFVRHQAQGFAERVLRWTPSGQAGDADALFRGRLEVAYWLAFTRTPREGEVRAARDFFAKFSAQNGGGSAGAVAQAKVSPTAWMSFCRALLASAEFRYLN